MLFTKKKKKYLLCTCVPISTFCHINHLEKKNYTQLLAAHFDKYNITLQLR